MVSALFDTNIVVDALMKRHPWASEANLLLEAVTRAEIRACISASALTDIFYICRKAVGVAPARQAVARCLTIFEILVVDEMLIREAMALPIDDVEDAVQVACAVRGGLDVIVTRDARGFALSPIPALTPAALLAQLGIAPISPSSGPTSQSP